MGIFIGVTCILLILIICIFAGEGEEYDNPNGCYKESGYTCLKCDKKNCIMKKKEEFLMKLEEKEE